MLAIIGGSGLTSLPGFVIRERRVLSTPFGNTSAPVVTGVFGRMETAFLARHGEGHSIAPHDINYRANLWALNNVGVSRIIAVATVGGIGVRYLPGLLVVPHQILDYTWGRKQTFFDDSATVKHVDFTQPYTEEIREALLASAKLLGETTLSAAVYAVTQGPRLETSAEIDRLERDGADIVGMTGMPEAVLARELGLAYGALAVVANFAAGRGESRNRIDLNGIHLVHQEAMQRVVRILAKLTEVLK